MLTKATAQRESGITYSNAKRIKDAAKYYHSVVMIRCVSGDNRSLNKQLYETKGYHIKAKSCNFGPMKEFVAVNPKFSKLSFKKGGYKKQQKLLDNAFEFDAGTTELYIPWARIEELKQGNFITDANDPIPDDLKKSNVEPHRKTIAVTATFVKTLGKGKIDKSINKIIKYVYYLSTVDREHDNPKAMYQVFYAESAQKHARPIEVLTNPSFNNSINQQRSVLSLDPDPFKYDIDYTGREHLKAVVADYDLFGIWTNIEDDYLKHYSHGMSGREYLLRFARCVPGKGAIYDLDNVRRFSAYEDQEQGNVSANLVKISKAINGIDNIDGGAPVDQDIQQVNEAYRDYMLRKFIQHSDEMGRPGVSEVDLPIYVVIPEIYKNHFKGEEELYIDTEADFFNLVKSFEKHPEFLLELNPGWEESITDELWMREVSFDDHVIIPGADNINSQYRQTESYGQERVKYLLNRGFNGVRQGDSESHAQTAGGAVQVAYTANTVAFGLTKVEWVTKLRAGTLFSENNYEYTQYI